MKSERSRKRRKETGAIMRFINDGNKVSRGEAEGANECVDGEKVAK